MGKVTYVCQTCRSTDILNDAWARWDPEIQEMVYDSHFDDTFCRDCEGETTAEEIPYAPAHKSNSEPDLPPI